MESISKSRIQGVRDPAHYTRLSPPFHPAAKSFPPVYHHFHPDAAIFHFPLSIRKSAATFHHGRNSTRLPPHYTRKSVATLHPVAATFHPDVSHPEFWSGDVPPSPDVSHPTDISGWEKRTFQTSTIRHIRIHRQRLPGEFRSQFCTVPRCSPEASRYVRPTSLDIFL